MNKLVAIGDIHGRSIWQQIVEQEQPDIVVFVGDYFDSYDIPGLDQINNFQNIIQWKLDNPQCQVIMLIGNHDFHYMPICSEKYSGFQRALWPEIGRVLEDKRHHLQMAFRYDDLVFSHAGISPEFLLNNKWGEQDMVEFLNDLWYYQPHKFKFADNGYGHSDPYGDDIFQGPLWIRPKSLMKACQDIKKTMIQVVGHTEVKQIDTKGKATGGRYYFIDCLGTSKEYLVYENKQIRIGKVTTES
jgi:predicted MPP superfamily phosphohydrolase